MREAQLVRTPFVQKNILVRQRRALERPGVAGGDAAVGLGSGGERPLPGYRDEGIERRIETGDAVEEGSRQLDAGKLSRAQTGAQTGDGAAVHRHGGGAIHFDEIPDRTGEATGRTAFTR